MILRYLHERFLTSRQSGLQVRINEWPGIIQNLIFPPICLLCGDPGAGDRDICPACLKSLPYLENACTACGLPIAMASGSLCGDCQKTPPPQDRLFTPLRYEEPVRHLIQGLKFGSRLAHARLLGALLAERIEPRPNWPEVLLPVPLHPSRYRERGFNQALEIARVVARRHGIPLNYQACRRTRSTEAQARLHADERRKNLRRAFQLTQSPAWRHVAIIDDVVTTGTTVGELAATLRRGGASLIEVWACARALPPK